MLGTQGLPQVPTGGQHKQPSAAGGDGAVPELC